MCMYVYRIFTCLKGGGGDLCVYVCVCVCVCAKVIKEAGMHVGYICMLGAKVIWSWTPSCKGTRILN
jgi:hypothetical protein